MAGPWLGRGQWLKVRGGPVPGVSGMLHFQQLPPPYNQEGKEREAQGVGKVSSLKGLDWPLPRWVSGLPRRGCAGQQTQMGSSGNRRDARGSPGPLPHLLK